MVLVLPSRSSLVYSPTYLTHWDTRCIGNTDHHLQPWNKGTLGELLIRGLGLVRRAFRQEKPQRFDEPFSLASDYAHIWKLGHAPRQECCTDSTEICHFKESFSCTPMKCAEISDRERKIPAIQQRPTKALNMNRRKCMWVKVQTVEFLDFSLSNICSPGCL